MTMPGADRPTFPEIYERELVGPLFRPFAEVLLDRVGLRDGDRLLDVACGTGIVARVAKARLGPRGHIVGVDSSPLMLAVARTAAPDLDWREGSAESLPVPSGEQFYVLTCQQGLQFFSDRVGAVREMHRVLEPEGRLAIATWRPIDEVPLVRDLHRAAELHLGPVVDRRHAFGDQVALASLVTGAGFEDVVVETVSKTIQFADAPTFLFLNAMALVGMSAGGTALSEDARVELAKTIARDSERVLPPYTQGQGIIWEIGTNVLTARR
jgi:ubiquinone/menaquinone biosynthesis C-methylase UbiE